MWINKNKDQGPTYRIMGFDLQDWDILINQIVQKKNLEYKKKARRMEKEQYGLILSKERTPLELNKLSNLWAVQWNY